jgi:hypothetical protein
LWPAAITGILPVILPTVLLEVTTHQFITAYIDFAKNMPLHGVDKYVHKEAFFTILLD